jgi:acylphosphatase
MVQGVGYRFFAQRIAENLRLSGYVRNLYDGRVEVFAIGTAPELAKLRQELERGPRLSSVSAVQEEPAHPEAQYASGFVIDESA